MHYIKYDTQLKKGENTMNEVSISSVLVKATREMLKEYSTIRFFSNYDNNERRINVNEIISIFETILDRIKSSHPNGEMLYMVLYQSYFHCKKHKRSQLCDILGTSLINRSVTESTLYRWQQMGIKVFAYALWTNPQFMDISMKIFTSSYLKKNYSEICLEHICLKKG